jgi:beta-barrel assembly-enhancing protease
MKKLNKIMKPLVVVALCAAFIGACAAMGKMLGSSYSPENDVALGGQADGQLKASREYNFLKPTDPNYQQITAYVNRIKDKLLAANDVPYEQQFRYQIQVVNQNVLNAFATAGGYMYLYTGIMKLLDNEAQLAGVVAHEMAHISNRHAINTMASQAASGTVLGILLGDKANWVQAIGAVAYQMVSLSYGRDQENEADGDGALWMSKTDYNPYQMQEFFRKMQNMKNAERPPEFLSTHPDPASRVQAIQNRLQQLGAPNRGNNYETEYAAFKRLLP